MKDAHFEKVFKTLPKLGFSNVNTLRKFSFRSVKGMGKNMKF